MPEINASATVSQLKPAVRWIALAACAALLAGFAILAWSASAGKSAAFDEPVTLVAAWAKTHHADFRCDPEDPPLPHYWIAVGTPAGAMLDRGEPLWDRMLHSMLTEGWYAYETLYQTPANHPDTLLKSARVRMVLIGVAVGALIAWWAWRWGGALAGVVAAAAFCLDPNFLAHSPLLKNDVAMALAFLALSAALWLAGERASVFRCAAVAIFLGAALATKYSGILGIPLIALALSIRAVSAKPWPVLGWVAGTVPQRLAAAAGITLFSVFVSYAFIWASYGFRFDISSDPLHPFDPQAAISLVRQRESLVAHGSPASPTPEETRLWDSQWRPGAFVQAVSWSLDHRVLPESWLVGLLFIHATSIIRATYLCGALSMTGWWYYFPLAFLFKTPLATLIALAIALMVALPRLRRSLAAGAWPIVAVALPAGLYLAAAMTTNLNVGLRHILPIYPFLFIGLGVTAAGVWRRRKVAGIFVLVLFAGLLAETLAAYPNYIPFFNVAVGGSGGGLKLLSDSNLDWGQDLPLVAKWQAEHPDRPVYLLYFGSADPGYYGLKRLIDPGSMDIPGERPAPRSGAVFAISATVMQGVYQPQQREVYQKFMRQKPLAVLGGTLYLFDWP